MSEDDLAGDVAATIDAAQAIKKEGNDLFGQGMYQEALELYHKAMKQTEELPDDDELSHDETTALINIRVALNLNIANCYIRLDTEWEMVEYLCDQVLRVPQIKRWNTNAFIKACYRKGMAQFKLGNHASALRILTYAQRHTHNNTSIATLVEQVEEAVQRGIQREQANQLTTKMYLLSSGQFGGHSYDGFEMSVGGKHPHFEEQDVHDGYHVHMLPFRLDDDDDDDDDESQDGASSSSHSSVASSPVSSSPSSPSMQLDNEASQGESMDHEPANGPTGAGGDEDAQEEQADSCLKGQEYLWTRKSWLNGTQLLRERELNGRVGTAHQTRLGQSYVPTAASATLVDVYDHRAYCGQYTDDGSLYFTACQDWNIRVYATGGEKKDTCINTIPTIPGQWTITDATVSPDQQHLIYSSIVPEVYMCRLDDPEHAMTKLDFNIAGSARSRWGGGFGIWSIRFSADGREVIAGTSDSSIYVYDVEAGKVVFRQQGHDDDVNAVAFASKTDSNVLFSGSDDNLIKVWDRRSMRSNEAGCLFGHSEGLTYLTPKGDGRYLISNCKDQTLKLWDIRTMMSMQEARQHYDSLPRYRWDYRAGEYPGDATYKHPKDRSVLTIRGHQVLSTLIRCHFSPAYTGQRYIYTGSADGSVYIYDLSGSVVETLDTTHMTQHVIQDYYGYGGGGIVRDCSWHPHAPELMAVTWDGGVIHFSSEKDDEDDE